jgi:uncharacterized tellurite resistance protein B-like protein
MEHHRGITGKDQIGSTLFSLWNRVAGTPKPEDPSPTVRLHLATCAILLEAAFADEEFSEIERAIVTNAICKRFSLSIEEGQELIEISIAKRRESPDLWHFTREINTACTREEKLAIVQELWAVVLADRTLHTHEDYLMHKLGKLLNLSHPELIQAKLVAKEEGRIANSE